jgi:hypothetical protein
MTELCALSHAESTRHIAQTPTIFSTQRIQVICILRDQDLSIDLPCIVASVISALHRASLETKFRRKMENRKTQIC